MSDIKALSQQFEQLAQRKLTIHIAGKEITIPEGWVAEFTATSIGFTVNMIKLSTREVGLCAEKRIEHRFFYYDPQGDLVAEQTVDTGWEASGPPLSGTYDLPSDYMVRN